MVCGLKALFLEEMAGDRFRTILWGQFLPTIWSWAVCITSLGPSFLIYEMEINHSHDGVVRGVKYLILSLGNASFYNYCLFLDFRHQSPKLYSKAGGSGGYQGGLCDGWALGKLSCVEEMGLFAGRSWKPEPGQVDRVWVQGVGPSDMSGRSERRLEK